MDVLRKERSPPFLFTIYMLNHGLQDKCVVSTCVEFNLYCTMLKHFHTSLTVICIICMLKHSPHLQNNTILRSYLFVKDFQFTQTAPYLNHFKIRPPPPKTINLATRDEEKNKRHRIGKEKKAHSFDLFDAAATRRNARAPTAAMLLARSSQPDQ